MSPDLNDFSALGCRNPKSCALKLILVPLPITASPGGPGGPSGPTVMFHTSDCIMSQICLSEMALRPWFN